jgi:prepilin-type processing-associated H-X9-DG protein
MVVGGGVSASHDWSWIDLGIETCVRYGSYDGIHNRGAIVLFYDGC